MSRSRPTRSVAQFDPKDPAASVPRLLAIRSGWLRSPPTPSWPRSGASSIGSSRAASGLVVADDRPPGRSRAGRGPAPAACAKVAASVPVRWLAVSYPAQGRSTGVPIELARRPPRQPRRGPDAARRHAA